MDSLYIKIVGHGKKLTHASLPIIRTTANHSRKFAKWSNRNALKMEPMAYVMMKNIFMTAMKRMMPRGLSW
ncbi:hypothetical protein KAM385_46530 [Aeromonas hydrophila]|nr:hypothetical protein KAM385_46530 [Aeromonas hydrophila]